MPEIQLQTSILRAFPVAEIKVFPVADGGNGTVDALVSGLNVSFRMVAVSDPLGRPVQAEYGNLPDQTAVIEMAAASGLPLLHSRYRLLTGTWIRILQ